MICGALAGAANSRDFHTQFIRIRLKGGRFPGMNAGEKQIATRAATSLPRPGRAVLVLVAALVMSFAGVVALDFFPLHRLEICSQHRASQRAFEVEVFRDGPRFICVSDWPWTFTSPATLCASPGLGRDDESWDGLSWSADGTVLAQWRQTAVMPQGGFVSAYDFREHRRISRQGRKDVDELDREILTLMVSRGGRGAPAVLEKSGDDPEMEMTAIARPVMLACGFGMIFRLLPRRRNS